MTLSLFAVPHFRIICGYKFSPFPTIHPLKTSRNHKGVRQISSPPHFCERPADAIIDTPVRRARLSLPASGERVGERGTFFLTPPEFCLAPEPQSALNQ